MQDIDYSMIDNHIIGSLREGRTPALQDAIQFEEQELIPRDIFLKQVEKLKAIYKDEFGINNKSLIERVAHQINKKGWRRNEITGKIEDRKGKHISFDNIYTSLIIGNMKLPKQDLMSLLNSDLINSYHPIKEYFENLENLNFDNETNYFAELSKYVISDNPEWFANMLKKHFIRAINQIFSGIPNRYVFCFVSPQLDGKSHFIKWTNPLPVDYYSERPMRNDKDSEILLSQVFIYSLEELEALSKSEVDKIKSIISRASINERKPYAAEAETRPRLASFFASTNNTEILVDTSNTRWLIFNIKKFDFDYNNIFTGIKKIDKNSLWFQAYNEWKKNKSSGTLTAKETELQEKINKGFQINSSEYNLIIKHIQEPSTDNLKDVKTLSATDILEKLQNIYPNIKINSAWIGREMKRAGFESSVRWMNGKAYRGYDIIWSETPINECINDLPF
ncbi:MAG: VapE family protein [Bacteroidales bacterium]|jgi:predicted P-loop ATPase|nr:VapE family protein [Bacteroidales bacterium]